MNTVVIVSSLLFDLAIVASPRRHREPTSHLLSAHNDVFDCTSFRSNVNILRTFIYFVLNIHYDNFNSRSKEQ